MRKSFATVQNQFENLDRYHQQHTVSHIIAYTTRNGIEENKSMGLKSNPNQLLGISTNPRKQENRVSIFIHSRQRIHQN